MFKYNEIGEQLMSGEVDTDIDVKQLGFIAEEIEDIFPELIEMAEFEDERYRAVNYIQMIPVLLEAIKELDNKICDINNGDSDERNET